MLLLAVLYTIKFSVGIAAVAFAPAEMRPMVAMLVILTLL